MAEFVKAYRLKDQRIELWRGDALTLSAGVVLFGCCRPLRARLEEIAGRRFEPAPQPTVNGRRFDLLPMSRSHGNPLWRLAVSLDYRPRDVRVDARLTSPNLTHVDKLSDDVWWALSKALGRVQGLGPVMLLPLSCRNPEVVAVSQVLAIWSAVIDGMPFGGGWQACRTFRFVDLADVSPYIRAMENRNRIITRTLRKGALHCMRDGLLERWAEHQFEPD